MHHSLLDVSAHTNYLITNRSTTGLTQTYKNEFGFAQVVAAPHEYLWWGGRHPTECSQVQENVELGSVAQLVRAHP